jgi:hypothetical protein
MQDRILIDELHRIEAAGGGKLLASAVVDAARPSGSPLHSHFDWDDSAAAEKYRLMQARQLIRVCVEYIRVGVTTKRIQAFVSLITDREAGGGYRSTVNVLAMDHLRAQLIEDAMLDMERFRAKYSSIAELADVFSKMDAVKSALVGRLPKAAKRA